MPANLCLVMLKSHDHLKIPTTFVSKVILFFLYLILNQI